MALDFSSPPRPTRMIAMPTFESSNSNCQVRSAAGENLSLPALAGEVASAQKHQMSELSKQQQFLQQLKEEYLKVQNAIKLVEMHVSAVSRKICLTEGDVAEKKAVCNDVQRKVEELIWSIQNLAAQIEMVKEKSQKEQEAYEHCATKMKLHSECVELFESQLAINREILEQKDRNARLRREVEFLRVGVAGSDDVISVSEERRLVQAEVLHLEEQAKTLEQKISQRRVEVKNEQERQAQLKRGTELFNKRNVAQLTRLKRQLQEVVARNRHWNEEACRLEESIVQTRNKIEGIANPYSI